MEMNYPIGFLPKNTRKSSHSHKKIPIGYYYTTFIVQNEDSDSESEFDELEYEEGVVIVQICIKVELGCSAVAQISNSYYSSYISHQIINGKLTVKKLKERDLWNSHYLKFADLFEPVSEEFYEKIISQIDQ